MYQPAVYIHLYMYITYMQIIRRMYTYTEIPPNEQYCKLL